MLVSFAMSLQSGSYEIMIDSATRYFTGHAQISEKSYVDQPRLDRTIENVQALQTALSAIDGLTVSPRVQAFAVVSKEKSRWVAWCWVWTLKPSSSASTFTTM